MNDTFRMESGDILSVMFFKQVQNVNEIIERSTNGVYPFSMCAIINPKLILEPFQISIAAKKAIDSRNSNTMITKSLPTELLFNLSISDNITESLQKFGCGNNLHQEILLAVFSNNDEQLQRIRSEVRGIHRPLTELGQTHDLDLIKKAYDITKEQLATSSLLNLIVTKIACKSV